MSDNLLRIGQIHFELLVNIDITGIKHWQATQQSFSSSYVKVLCNTTNTVCYPRTDRFLLPWRNC